MTLKPYDKWYDISSSTEACITDISTWMNSIMLKLIIQHVKKTQNLRIKVGSSYINYSMSIRNQGLILDNTLGMEKQVNYKCKSCYYQIRNIGLICKYLNDETCKTLVQALVNS